MKDLHRKRTSIDCRFDPWPGNFHMLLASQKKKKKKTLNTQQKKDGSREFPGGLVIMMQCFHPCSPGSVLSLETEILYQEKIFKIKIKNMVHKLFKCIHLVCITRALVSTPCLLVNVS